MALSRDELLRRARSGIREVDAAALRQLASSTEAPLILDVREPEEVDAGIIPGSRHIARGLLEMVIEEAVPDRGRPITVVCTGGNRSLLAAMTLVDMGYCDVTSLAGGFEAWKAAGHPVDVDKPLSRSERHRYARHLSLPMVGEAGQKKLLAAKVLLVGAGGLGSPCGYYLAAAGVGTLGIVDDDVVDTSNLQRQILHRDEDQGKLKADSAERALKGLNPGVTVVKHVTRMRSANALELMGGYDVIVDGTDNFPTRYLLNDAAVFLGKPLVHGSIFRFEGQASVFMAGKGPCYRCLYPAPPPPGLVPSCVEGGVLGVLPGIIGCVQAMEAIKVILGVGHPLVGRLLQFDALAMRFREMKLQRDKRCPVCGDNPTIAALQDYDAFCTAGG